MSAVLVDVAKSEDEIAWMHHAAASHICLATVGFINKPDNDHHHRVAASEATIRKRPIRNFGAWFGAFAFLGELTAIVRLRLDCQT
jgi:hypothetical protein